MRSTTLNIVGLVTVERSRGKREIRVYKSVQFKFVLHLVRLTCFFTTA